MFDKMSLSSIANSIGKPICIDARNVNRSMLHCALVCVELDVSKKLLEEIWIGFRDDATGVSLGGFCVKVKYDFVPHFCSSCSHLGHNSVRCKSFQNSGLVGVNSGCGEAATDSHSREVTSSGLPHLPSSRSHGDSSLALNVKCAVSKEKDRSLFHQALVWLPVNKGKALNNKGKADTGKDIAVVMSNSFDILVQQQDVSSASLCPQTDIRLNNLEQDEITVHEVTMQQMPMKEAGDFSHWC